ncbi:PucR family transcriptional regulator [Nocardia jejuensis]|uniref:PucR family transcriptional regulator n=1 Tax=Nocardia jejuensis TaxID=328049 RepID=UPI0008309EC7|nr:PucR family transcriptional regulator [Nocardia jejuensis]
MPATPHQLTLDSPIITRLLPRISKLGDELFDAALATVPGAEFFPPGHFTDDVASRIISGVVSVLNAIEDGQDLDEQQFAELVAPVVQRRAEERIPLRLLMIAFFGGVRRLWSEMTEQAEHADLPDLIAMSNIMLDVMMHTTITMAETHSEVERSIYGSEREARRELCAALLRGAHSEDLAARADTAITAAYDMIAIQVMPADRSLPMADHAIARRRMVQAQQVLDELAGGTSALHTFDGTAGIALLPPTSGELRYEKLAEELASRFGLEVVVIEFGTVPRAELAESGAQIKEFGILARKLGRPTGTYGLDDLMLEYQLTRPSPARDRLASRIVPLIDHPHLLEALETHIRFGSDRKSAAAAMHLHPNSFSYRLRRVAELTGFDPSDPYDSRMLAAALTVHRLAEPDPTRLAEPDPARVAEPDPARLAEHDPARLTEPGPAPTGSSSETNPDASILHNMQ